MSIDVIIRCEKCGKVLKGKAQKGYLTGICPRCCEKLQIPVPVAKEGRKYHRAIVGENKLVTTVPETFCQSKSPPVYRVMYTEVPPVDFVLNRSTHVPLLDLSEGGMGLFVRADKVSEGLIPGNSFVAEIDFPILVQPILVKVEICWIHPIKEEKVMQLGVKFCDKDESFKDVLVNLMKYIELRTGRFDFDKWRTFG